MSRNMEQILREAVAQGLLADADRVESRSRRHWSVVLLTGVAAWFSAVPLLLIVALMLSPAVHTAAACLFVGVAMLCGSVLVLRWRTVPLFVEQLGVPCLIASEGLVGVGLFDATRSLSETAALLVPVTCVVAWQVKATWLRTLLGAGIACLMALAILAELPNLHLKDSSVWLPWHATALVWLALQVLQHRVELDRGTAPALGLLEAVSGGMAGVTLVGLAIFSGDTFLLGKTLGWLSYSSVHGHGLSESEVFVRLASVTFASLGAAWIASCWAAVRTKWFLAIACLAAVTAWFAPFLGVVLLMLGVCTSTQRYSLAALAGTSALWMIGGFYYQLNWALGEKAGLLAGVGIAIGIIALFAIPGKIELPAQKLPRLEPEFMPERKRRIGFLASGLLALTVANASIWEKESLIRTGNPVFVELAPVDPRSLMQGDFMALRFILAPEGPDDIPFAPIVVARSDARGVASLVRADDGKPLAKGEFRIKFLIKDNDWTIATNAWYFKEGEGDRWARAKYGEFRIDSAGRSLLVGLRGPNLEKL